MNGWTGSIRVCRIGAFLLTYLPCLTLRHSCALLTGEVAAEHSVRGNLSGLTDDASK